MKLYHGSNTYIKDTIAPHISFHYKPYVYATTDYNYALLRAGKFSPEKLMLKEDYDGQIITLIELYEGAFIDALFTEGYVYVVDSYGFEHTDDCRYREYINTKWCNIEHTFVIGNVLKEIVDNPHFKLIYYKDSDEYFKSIRGGKDGYLQRRKERIEKLKTL